MGYTKNIAVIKELKQGFSADGGALSGLIKAEKYGSGLRVEVTYINFAPLSEGRYVTAVSDGARCEIIENGLFDGKSEVDTSGGFAALVCYVNKKVSPIAGAVCGAFHGVALTLKAEVEKAERIIPDDKKSAEAKTEYEDEAIAEENYYEYDEKTDADGKDAILNEGGEPLRADSQKEKDGRKPREDETAACAVEDKKSGLNKEGKSSAGAKPLSRGGNFYEKMKAEIEGILSAYPKERGLEGVVEGSEWVRISYGDDRFYVFGIIRENGVPRYICYGVPSAYSETPPESMKGLASFIPCPNDGKDGFFVMYQDAVTGASLKAENF